MAQEPKLMLPVGHTRDVYSASFSPDGKYVVTSGDNTAKVWEAVSGLLVTDLKGHTNLVTNASFSPDGKNIVTVSWDGTSRIWNALSGQLVTDLKEAHYEGVGNASFSPDGKYLVTVANILQVQGNSLIGDSNARVWNTVSGKLVVDLNGHTDLVSNAFFSPACPDDPAGGKFIVTVSRDSTARIWNATSGQLKATLKGHTANVHSASFSPNGKYIVTASDDKTARVWNAVTGGLVADLKKHTKAVRSASFSPDGKYIVTGSVDKTARIWNTVTGELVAELKGHTKGVGAASFSPDGKFIVTASSDSTAGIWNAASGLLIAALKGHTSWVWTASFSPDGKFIVTASGDKTARVWDAVTGALVADLRGHSQFVSSSSFSANGKYLVTASFNGTATVWDVVKGQPVAIMKGHTNWIYSAYFSPDGKYIVTASMDSSASVWDAVSGQLVAKLKANTNAVYSASFSPDGKYIVTLTFNDSTIRIWNALSGQLVTALKGHTDQFNRISFSPDGKYLVTNALSLHADSTTRVWNAATGQLVTTLNGHTRFIFNAAFSPACADDPKGGKYIVTASADHTARVWNAVTGQLVTTLKAHTAEISNASFSPDGKYIVTASADNTARVWDAVSGQPVTILSGHKRSVHTAAFSPDGKYVVTVSGDSTAGLWNAVSGQIIQTTERNFGGLAEIDFKNMRITNQDYSEVSIYNLETGKKLYTLLAVDSSDYLIVDKDNRYDGTPAARKLLYFTCGAEIIELEQVKDQLWVPNLAERIMNVETINAQKLSELNICDLTPKVEDAGSKADEYYFKILPRHGGLGETVMYVNGIEAKRYKPGQLNNNAGTYELVVKKNELINFFIAGAANPVVVKAYTSNNAISSRGVVVTAKADSAFTISPSLYAVMVGVSDYKGTELDLKYAAKDAVDISAAVSGAAKKLLNTDGKEHVFMYNLTTAKERYQLPEKLGIKKILEEIGKKATANDILLIFFAGHGVMTGEADKKQFYFLTADASTLSTTAAVKDVGISTAELTEWMKPQNIKAQKRILIFDACNSGQAIKDFVQLGNDNQNYLAARNDDKTQQIKAIDKLNEKSGLFILSASASNQAAYEMGRYSQGLLTYSLLKAIKQQPEILEDGKYLNISRWFNAAEKTVSDLSKESGARQEPQIVSNTNFNIGVVDEEVMVKIILPAEKPLFTASNFQNSDEAADGDDLELSKLINLKLNEISTRGPDSRIVYVLGSNSPDAYTMGGRYDVKGNEITVRISIRQHKEVKQRFELNGTKVKLNELAAMIADKAAGMVK